MYRATLTAVALVALLMVAAVSAIAQPAGPVFRIVEDQEPRRGVVSGWLHNDGQGVVGLVRMRLEVLDAGGQVVSEHLGWAYGNVPPGGRAYFRIAAPMNVASRRLSVESFVLQSLQAP